MVEELCLSWCFFFFFFNDTATTEIYTLSLHDALPISSNNWQCRISPPPARRPAMPTLAATTLEASTASRHTSRSEEHTSELQSQSNLVCRLLLEKKNSRQTSLSASSSTRIQNDTV